MQCPRKVQNGTQFVKVPAHSRSQCFLFRPSQLLYQPLQLGAIQSEDQLVGILDAKFDLVGVVQRLLPYPFAIDERTVSAAGILDGVLAVFRRDPRVHTRSTAVSDYEVVVGLASDPERERDERHARAMTVRINHDQRSRFKASRVESRVHRLAPPATPGGPPRAVSP